MSVHGRCQVAAHDGGHPRKVLLYNALIVSAIMTFINLNEYACNELMQPTVVVGAD